MSHKGRLARVTIDRMMVYPPLSRAIEHTAVRAFRRYPSARLSQALVYYVRDNVLRNDDHRIRYARLGDGSLLACRLYETLWSQIYFGGVWEPATTAFVRRWLRPGDVFLDIGSNNGYFTTIGARAVGPSGQVHAFEPNPVVFELLERSIVKNRYESWVHLNRAAIGDQHGVEVSLYLPPDHWNTGESSLLAHAELSGGAAIQVPMVRLDSYCQETMISRVRLVKMDIEGAELMALAGAQELMTAIRPDAVVCETESYSQQREPLMQAFRLLGYTPLSIAGDGSVAPLRDATPTSADPNLCFVPRAN
jgi:FkbM family methyltransferase